MINITIWILTLILFFLLYRLKAFTGNRVIYLAILSFISFLIVGRFACKNLKCITYLPTYDTRNKNKSPLSKKTKSDLK